MTTAAVPTDRSTLVLEHRPLDGVRRVEHTEDLEQALRDASCREEEETLREELTVVNIPVALSVARRYRDRGIDSEDLEQVALLGLTKAAERYDAGAGHAFLSYCVPTVRGEVLRYFRDHGWAVRPPRRIQELQHQLLDLRATLHADLGHPPTQAELAEESGVDVEEVREALDGRACFTPVSLDRRAGDEEDGQPMGELIGVEDSSQGAAEARTILAPVVRRLSSRDRHILQMRFFEERTQREIADRIGVTQMQVSRLLDRIFRDIRQSVGELDLPAAAG